MLQDGNYTKATINGKKCGLVVYEGKIYLLSYVRRWNLIRSTEHTDLPGDFPRHGFHRAIDIWCLEEWEESFEQWRDRYLHHGRNRTYGITSIAFPGEEGFEREIVRYRRNRTESTELPNPPAEVVIEQAAPTLTNEGEGIDFYLPNYTTRNVYSGQNGYHNSHARGFMNQPRVSFSGHRIGVELEIEANDGENHRLINRQKSNWFTQERDGSLGSYGVELITIPLLPTDAKSYATWKPLTDFLQGKALSWNTGRCGLHVHIGREILGETEAERQMTLGKILIFYQGDIEMSQWSKDVFGRERCYSQRDGETDEIKAVRCLGKGVLKDADALRKVDTAMKRKFAGDRYYAVNITNNATIEFRKGKGSVNPDRIIAIVTFSEAICLFCKETAASDLTLDNFKEWLLNHVERTNPLYTYINVRREDV